jgi:hypothetical protein
MKNKTLHGLACGLASLMILGTSATARAAVLAVPADYGTIQAAIAAAQTGDVVQVAPGLYHEKQIIIDKAICVVGQDATNTIIDGGGDDDSLELIGLVRITAPGSVAFTGFTLCHANSVGGVKVALYVSSPVAASAFLVARNRILGSGDPEDMGDYGLYAFEGRGSLFVLKNEISETGSNPILIERHPGPTDISFNDLDVGVFGSDAIFTMTYGNLDIPSLQKRNSNNINLGTGAPFDQAHWASGITFAGAFRHAPYTESLGGGRFTRVQIMHNTFYNMQSWRRGVTLWNGAGGGMEGDIVFAAIQGNQFQGVNQGESSKGVQIIGRITGAKVINNHFRKLDIGIHLREWQGAAPLGTKLNANRFSAVNTAVSIAAEAQGTRHHADHVSP